MNTGCCLVLQSRHAASLLVASLLFIGGPVSAQTPDIAARSELRVCADPNNLPFSDEKKEGFENKIAELMGSELGVRVDYVWFPQVSALCGTLCAPIFVIW